MYAVEESAAVQRKGYSVHLRVACHSPPSSPYSTAPSSRFSDILRAPPPRARALSSSSGVVPTGCPTPPPDPNPRGVHRAETYNYPLRLGFSTFSSSVAGVSD